MRRARRAPALLLAGLLVLSACASSSRQQAKGSDASASSAAKAPEKQTFGPDDDDTIIKRAIDDVQSFYEAEFPKLYGGSFTAISGGEFPYGPDDPPPECGGAGLANYQDVQRNAFYCPPSDFVAWDTVNLTNDLLDSFGEFSLAIVVAHELGHAIQARHGILAGNEFPTFVTEQQADCFAGSYTKHVLDGGSKAFDKDSVDLDNALGGFLAIRDPVGTDSVNDTAAHGSAFQRINAFEDGLQGGTAKCKTYEDESFDFVPEVFDPGSLDESRAGNLPFREVEPLVIANLEGFWTAAFADINKRWTTARTNPFDPVKGVTCDNDTIKGDDAVGLAFYCSADDTLNWDEKTLMPHVHDKIGDLAEAVIIANEYSQRAQKLAGLATGGTDAVLQADCFTGVWVATTKTGEINNTLPDTAQVQLSPGDLDEAVSAFLQFPKITKAIDPSAAAATSFQHLDAFRNGFFTTFNGDLAAGLSSCTAGGGASAASSGSSSS
jgi:predicted metalloprotease